MNTIDDILKSGHLTTISSHMEWDDIFIDQADTNNIPFISDDDNEDLNGLICYREELNYFITRNNETGLIKVMSPSEFSNECKDRLFKFSHLFNKPNSFYITNELIHDTVESDDGFTLNYNEFQWYYWLHNSRHIVPKVWTADLFNLPGIYEWLAFTDNKYVFFTDFGDQLNDLSEILVTRNITTACDDIYPNKAILTFSQNGLTVTNSNLRTIVKYIPKKEIDSPTDVIEVFEIIRLFTDFKKSIAAFTEKLTKPV